MKFHHILIILTCNTAVRSPVQLKYGEFKSFPVVVYANLFLAHDLVETVLIGCKICLNECYVQQYGLISYSLKCLGVIILHMIVCTAIHHCLSSGSLFFATLRQNN